ncbi:MAG: lipopolysaccharide biosynthesis protein [Candidatus Competibacteraceae bacterium]
MTNVRKSLAITFAERYSVFFIQFASSLILARLLTPQEIGVFSVGSVIVSLSHVLRDFGVSNYLIQEKDLTWNRVRAAQSMLLLTSWSLAILLFFAAEPLARLYREPGMSQILRVLSLNFILLPFGAVTLALLRRDMRFISLYGINTASALAHAITAITLAYTGFGFMSLAWAGLASVLTSTVAAIFCRQPGQPWLPGLTELPRVLSVGSRLSSTSFLWELGTGGPELITGRVLGFEPVGYLSRAYGAVNLVYRTLVETLQPVMIPFFASKAREQGDLEGLFRHGLACLSAIAWPAFACLAIGAEPIILLLYGHQWNATIIPLRILCVGMAILTIANIGGSIALGMGKVQLIFKMHGIFQPLKLVAVALGAMLGLKGVVTGIVLGDTLLSVYCTYQVGRLLGTKTFDLAHSLLPSVWITLITAVSAWMALIASASSFVLLQVAAISLGATVGWLIGLWVTGHILLEELSFVRNGVLHLAVPRYPSR